MKKIIDVLKDNRLDKSSKTPSELFPEEAAIVKTIGNEVLPEFKASWDSVNPFIWDNSVFKISEYENPSQNLTYQVLSTLNGLSNGKPWRVLYSFFDGIGFGGGKPTPEDNKVAIANTESSDEAKLGVKTKSGNQISINVLINKQFKTFSVQDTAEPSGHNSSKAYAILGPSNIFEIVDEQ